MPRHRFVASVVFLSAAVAVAQTPPPAPPATPPATPSAAPPMTPPAAPAAPAAGDKQSFETKFEKDKPFYQEQKTTVAQTIKVQGGSDIVQKHEHTFRYKWTPVAQAGDKWTVKQTVEGVKMMIDIAGNQVNYDSAAPDAAAGTSAGLADFFGKLVGSEFTLTVGKGGAVEKVEGKDEFVKKLGGVNNQMEALLKKMLTDEAMKQMTDPTAGLTPPAPKGVGETWEKKTTFNLGPIGGYELTGKYTYKGKDPQKKDYDRVEVVQTVVYKAPTEQQEGLLFKIKGGELKSLDATPDAKPSYFLFDPKAGRVAESSVSVKLKGTLNVTIGNADTAIELYQEQTSEVKSGDKSFLPEAKK